MDFYGTGVGLEERSAQASERNGTKQKESVRKSGDRLRAIAGVLLTLAATMPASYGAAGWGRHERAGP